VALLGVRKVFVGFANYQKIFSSPKYYHSLEITLIFVAAVVLIGLAVSLGLAVLANQKIRGARFYRTALIWPYALSPAAAGTVWFFLFTPVAGLVNYVLDSTIGIRPDWFGDKVLALALVTGAAIWKNLGYNVIFYLAALQNVPKELLEAAQVDGAGAFRRFWKVTFPLLGPTTFFLLTMNMIYAFFETFPIIDIMTRGGPGEATNTLIYNLYRDAFRFFKTGVASAQSVILFLFVLILTFLQFRTVERRVHYGA
jgi:sn-glycerol 3-phosphate transport system permease protein